VIPLAAIKKLSLNKIKDLAAKKIKKVSSKKETDSSLKNVKKELPKKENDVSEKNVKKKVKKLSLKKEHYFLGGIVLLFVAVILVTFLINPTSTDQTGVKNAAKLEMYVMSQCPYGTQVMDAIKPVKEQFGKYLDLDIEYISYSPQYYAGREAQMCLGDFCGMHGVNEVKGNIVELCAAKYNPDSYLNMIYCMNQNASSIPNNWEICAQQNNLNVDKIKSCYNSDEGVQLLQESSLKANERNATGSPTIYLNNKQYSGGRTAQAFTSAICAAYDYNIKPCESIPKPKTIKMIVLNDKRCDACASITGLYGQLRSLFPGLKIEELDYSTTDGKSLYDSIGIEYLPALLFEANVVNSSSYDQIKSYLVPVGSYLSLRIGADFNPASEICDNGIDDTGNGLIDCNDSDCVGTMECKPEIKNDVQVFVMSDCPYGKEAIKALKGVVDNFGNAITYEVHYIASEQGGEFSSLHGAYEVNEDIVQLCVKNYSPDEWLDYIYCRSVNGVKNIDWKTCATSANVNISAVETCSQGEEGKELLRTDIKLAQELGIGASPTWLANNKYTFSGIDSETVRSQMCRHNSGLVGCDNVLNTTSNVSGSCS